MSAIFTKNFGVVNAKNFERLTTGVFANTYIGIGRQTVWANSDTAPTPVDTANTFYDLWNNLIGVKKLTAADMNLVIPRVDWETGTTYVEYSQDTQLFTKANTANVAYDNKFYARNTRDQVFKCLFNNNVASTIMPEIDIDGQLPENAFIETGDGYKWKYMYTIPAGLKEKFFTSQYMPVVSEAIVTNNAVDGRLDIIKIIDGGRGFNNNANSTSYNILTITGDGSNANITVKVETQALANGANITDYNIISGGNNYTRAAISIVDPLKIANTANANLVAVIGPPGGHGSDVEQELGASNLMICVEIEGDQNGAIPINGNDSQFRQICILKDPLLANGAYATGTAYGATKKLNLTEPNKSFDQGETVYVGSSLAAATYTGVVDSFDNVSNYLYLNNETGSIVAPTTIIGANSGAIATVLLVTDAAIKKYSGDLLYIENNSKITRHPTETQQFKLTLRF